MSSSSFVDTAQVHAKAGNGGAGAVSFRRESHVPRGGPDGGDGGDGGDVWLVADHNVASLLSFRDHPHRAADSGQHGQGKQKHGKRGASLEARVPVGTVVKGEGGEVLADLHTEGMRYLAARGGKGGRGNARFLANNRRAPAFAEQAEVGEEWWLDLELKLMADVALVGFPNAGKSTFISTVSAAKPKIADYPFTTLEPHLGVVRVGEREMVIADIPGLIEGASEGKGLGHSFLRHIERARVLLVLIDLASTEGRDPNYQLEALLHELGNYEPELLERPRVVVGTKADAAVLDWDGDRISAATNDGLTPLLGRLMDLVDAARAETPVGESYIIHRPEPEGFRIDRVGSGNEWVVLGRSAQRAVALSDLTDQGALLYAQQRLKKLGVDRALARAGVQSGDVVRIGGFVFEYEPD
jgi:GTP-binding protein